MYSDHDLDVAVAAGVIDRASVDRLRDYLAASRQAPIADEEHFRLLSGFNDIFVSIATILLLGALAWLGQAAPLGQGDLADALAGGLVAAMSWALAEFFTKRRRMALPSILLLLSFVTGTGVAVFWSIHAAIAQGRSEMPLGASGRAFVAATVATAVAAAAFVHWRRFRVPITVAVVCAGLVALSVSVLTAVVPSLQDQLAALGFAAGLGVFALALRWDLTDPERQTRRSDVAFWLHLLAAPLIVHSAVAMSGVLRGSVGVADAAFVVAIYIALGVVALVIDRRALMVSGLAYVIYAMSNLFHEMGAFNLNVALTALVMGSALLGLSVCWPGLRRTLVSRLPRALGERLPPAALPGSR